MLVGYVMLVGKTFTIDKENIEWLQAQGFNMSGFINGLITDERMKRQTLPEPEPESDF